MGGVDDSGETVVSIHGGHVNTLQAGTREFAGLFLSSARYTV